MLIPASFSGVCLGNCYSASIFLSLASLVGETGAGLASKRVLMFSYGSGSMASLYTITGRPIIYVQTRCHMSSLFRLERTRVLFTFNAGGGAPTILFS